MRQQGRKIPLFPPFAKENEKGIWTEQTEQTEETE